MGRMKQPRHSLEIDPGHVYINWDDYEDLYICIGVGATDESAKQAAIKCLDRLKKEVEKL